MNKSKPIFKLGTKLHIPDLPTDYIERPGLIEYLNKDILRPLTLISAGAGYGKSTLVSSWLKTIPYKKCWFSIDENDNELRIFLSYFISAVQTQIPDFGTNLHRTIFLSDINSPDILTNNLLSDINEIKEDIFLVLEDFQVINNMDITNLIANILKYPLSKFHLVIISRTDPPIPLYKLRAANKIKEVRFTQLKLSSDETKELLKDCFNTKNYNKYADSFNERFEGWITGIRLLKIHLSYVKYTEDDLKGLVNNSRIFETYFIEELLKNIDKETLIFLLKTSLLNKFNKSLTSYILSDDNHKPDSEKIIKDLLNRNLFLINLDGQREWFRYHHLFQNILKKELTKRYSQKEIININKKIIEWYIHHDLYEDAFYHITQLNDTELTAEFVKQNYYRPLNHNKWFILELWLKHLPENVIDECPELLMAKTWTMQHKGAFWIIPELINKAENLKNSKPQKYKAIELQQLFFKGVIDFWNNNIDNSLKLFDYVRKNAPNNKIGELSLSTIYYAIAAQMTGKGDTVFNEIEMKISSRKIDADYKLILLGSLIYIKILSGDLFKAKQITEKLAYALTKTDNNFYDAWYEFFIGYINFQQYNLKNALEHFYKAMKYIYLLNINAPIDTFAGILIIHILQKTKNKDEYDKIYNQLSNFVYECNNPTYTNIALSLKARLAILTNNVKESYNIYKLINKRYSFDNITFDIEFPKITECKLLIALNKAPKTEEAINKLTGILNFVNKTNNIIQSIEVHILLAAAFVQQNSNHKSIHHLSKAISLAEKGKVIYPFVEQAKYIFIILPKIKSNNENIKEFLSLLTKIIKKERNRTLKTTASNKNLSNREIDIILLLAKRLSNKEIANKLFISEGTVKRHTINIYKKLGVNRRKDAVGKARNSGLISF
jgi:LuxR family maltose regulon positive regulatory protein